MPALSPFLPRLLMLEEPVCLMTCSHLCLSRGFLVSAVERKKTERGKYITGWGLEILVPLKTYYTVVVSVD